VTFAERLSATRCANVEKRSLWGRFPTRITSGDLAEASIRAAYRGRGLKPPKFVKEQS
jgi:hypothetical protein